MTKMPDKIGPVCYDCGLEKGCSYTHEPSSGNCAVCGRINMFNDRVVNSDLIPQPITDEARQRALAWIESEDKTNYHIYCEANHYGHEGTVDDCIEKNEIFETIRAALSQPSIPVQDAKAIISKAEVQGETVALTGGANPPTGATQPEAIQKAVEALTDCANGYAYIKAFKTDAEKSGIGYQRCLENALQAIQGLRTHQSELEALKAENAELRQAVVDLDDALTNAYDEKHCVSFNHYATIAKAKGE